jgi:hypothetical protein
MHSHWWPRSQHKTLESIAGLIRCSMFANAPDGYLNVFRDDCIPGHVAAHMPLVNP